MRKAIALFMALLCAMPSIPASAQTTIKATTVNAGTITVGRIQNDCHVGSTTYPTWESVQADSTNCKSLVVPSGFVESFTGGVFTFTRLLPVIFDGCGISLTGQITAAGTVNSIAMMNWGALSNGAAACVDLNFTGTSSAAVSIGDSSTHSKDFSMRGVNINTSGNGVACWKLANIDEFDISWSKCSNSSGTSPIGVTTIGTGTFVGVGKFDNVHILMRGTNSVGYDFQTLTSHVQVMGGNIDLDAGAAAICFHVQGANTQSIELVMPNANTCNTAVKVEGTATATGAIYGAFRIDSGVTTVANFAAGTVANQLKCVNCATNAVVVNAGSNNGVEFPINNQVNGNAWVQTQTSAAYAINEKVANVNRLAFTVGGDTNLDAAPNSIVHIGHNSPGNTLSVENGGTPVATIDSTGAAVVATIKPGGGTVLTGTIGAGTKIATNSAVQIFEFGCTGTAVSSNTVVLNFPGIAPACTNTTSVKPAALLPSAGTLVNLRVLCTTGGSSASSGIFTIFDNGSSTALTCTTGTGTSCSDTTHSPVTVAGHELQVKFTTQAAETLANCEVAFEKQ